LTKEGKAEWRRLAPELVADGRLTFAEVVTFALYCHAVGRLRQVAERITAEGIMVDGPQSRRVRHPLLGLELQLAAEVRVAGGVFGLNPAARARACAIPPSEENDSFEDFLKGIGTKN
jgi:P27 family predicted phage terminase small subunit